MNRRSRLSSASPAMGLTKRPASENGRSALRPGGSGALPKNRVPLTDISNASRRKNSEKPSSSSIGTKGGNLVIILSSNFSSSLSFNGSGRVFLILRIFFRFPLIHFFPNRFTL